MLGAPHFDSEMWETSAFNPAALVPHRPPSRAFFLARTGRRQLAATYKVPGATNLQGLCATLDWTQ